MLKIKYLFYNSLLNLILMFLLYELLLNVQWTFSVGFMFAYSIVSIFLNSYTFFKYLKLSSNDFVAWIFSLFFYIAFTVVIFIIFVCFGTGDDIADEENYAAGIILLITLCMSVGNLIIGNGLAVLMKKIKSFRKRKK